MKTTTSAFVLYLQGTLILSIEYMKLKLKHAFIPHYTLLIIQLEVLILFFYQDPVEK